MSIITDHKRFIASLIAAGTLIAGGAMLPAAAMADSATPTTQTTVTAPAATQDDTTKSIVISQKDLTGTTGWYATDASHKAPKPDKNTTPGGLKSFAAGKYTLSYKVTDEASQANEGNYTIIKNTTADKDGVLAYEAADKSGVLTLKDGASTEITFTAGSVIVIPKAEGASLGDFTLTPVKSETTTPTPDKTLTLTVDGSASKTGKDLKITSGNAYTVNWKAKDAKKPNASFRIGSKADAKGVIADADLLYTATVTKDGAVSFTDVKTKKTVDHVTLMDSDVFQTTGTGTVTLAAYKAPSTGGDDKPATVSYDFDLSKVPVEAGSKLNGHLGIVALADGQKVPTALNPADRKDNPYTVEQQYAGVQPGKYKVTYKADAAKKQLQVANGGTYDKSSTDKQGVFGPATGAKYASWQVAVNGYKPADGKTVPYEYEVELPAGAYLTVVGDSNMGTLHLDRIGDVTGGNTDQKPGQQETVQATMTVTGSATKTAKDLSLGAGDWTVSWKAKDTKKPSATIVLGSKADKTGKIADADILYKATVAKDGKVTFTGKDGKTVDHVTVTDTTVIHVEGDGTVTFDKYTAPKPDNNDQNKPDKDQNKPTTDQNKTDDTTFENCTDANNAGYSNMKKGEAGYASALDKDNDGVACESNGDDGDNNNGDDTADKQETEQQLASTGATVSIAAGVTTLLASIGAAIVGVRKYLVK